MSDLLLNNVQYTDNHFFKFCYDGCMMEKDGRILYSMLYV